VGLLSLAGTSVVQLLGVLVRGHRATPVINEDVNLELYELLELYCELLIARFGLLDQKYGALLICWLIFQG
jgi:hypothetical protein